MDRAGKYIQLMTGVSAFVLTPLIMIAAYATFASLAAIQFRILDVTTDYAAGVATATILMASIYLWPIPAYHRFVLMQLWLIRIGVTLGFMLVYEALYGLDASMYYLTGKNLNAPMSQIGIGDGTQNIRAIVALLSDITGSYNAMKVIFAYVGLIAIYIFYRAAVICLGQEKLVVLYALGLLPSLLFWTSILGKDPIVLLGIAIYVYGVAGLLVRQKMSMLVFVAIGVAIAALIRVWLGVIFLTPLIATYVLAGRASIVTKTVFILISFPAFLVTLQGFADQFSLETAQDLLRRTDAISGAWAHGGSAQVIEHGFTSLQTMILFMPLGSFTALFRPLPLEVPNVFGTLAGLENLFILSLIVLGVLRSGFGWMRQPILLWAVLTLLVWGSIYGFASFQNLGTAFRFRAQVSPILLMLGLYLTFARHLSPGRNLRLAFWPERPW